jgi:NADH-quinone oxidoreductase subunit A
VLHEALGSWTRKANRLAHGRAGFYCAAVDQTQLQQYVPVLMLALLAVIFTGGMLVGSALLGFRGRRNRAKDTPWECGIIPAGGGGTRLGVRFYLVAMLFILFDIEVVFLYPWAVVYREMLRDPATKNLILCAMLSFLGVLFAGYLYALKKRAFDWKS